MKLSHLIHNVCRLASAASAFNAAELKKRFPGKTLLTLADLTDLPTAPQKKELRQLLHAQSPANLYMLLTLWRLGRGDFPPDCDLLDEYLEASDCFPNVQAVVNYLMGKHLTRYFDAALRQLKESAIDVDKLLE